MHFDQPLSDQEFDQLDQFLLSERCAEDGMTMDILHGFLTALAIGPEEVPPAEWLPHVWGPSQAAPEFKSEQESRRIAGLIARFMNEITLTLEVAPKEFEPLFCEFEFEGEIRIDAEGWAWGFWEGMMLREPAWEPILHSELAGLMRPFALLGAEEIAPEDEALIATSKQREKLAFEIEDAIPKIYRFWLPRRKSTVGMVTRGAPKTGRNDPCPCGSGKKFKKCCGANDAGGKAGD